MKNYWFELEEFVKELKKESHPSMYMIACAVQTEMERIKSEFYYQSLKEAGYF